MADIGLKNVLNVYFMNITNYSFRRLREYNFSYGMIFDDFRRRT